MALYHESISDRLWSLCNQLGLTALERSTLRPLYVLFVGGLQPKRAAKTYEEQARSKLESEVPQRGIARDLYERALAIYEQLENVERKAFLLDSIGVLFHQERKLHEATSYCKHSLDTLKPLYHKKEKDTAIMEAFNGVCQHLAQLYCEQSNFAEAEPLLRISVEILSKAGGPCKELVEPLGNLAIVLHQLGRLPEAMKENEKAFKAATSRSGDSNKTDEESKTMILMNMATISRQQGHFSQAMKLYNQVHDIFSKVPDMKRTAEYARLLSYMAIIQMEQGRF